MARSTRGLRNRAVRGGRGTWKTYDLPAGPVRDMRGWDFAAKAFLDGGGVTLHGITQNMPDLDPDTVPDRRTTRRTPRTRKGGRR